MVSGADVARRRACDGCGIIQLFTSWSPHVYICRDGCMELRLCAACYLAQRWNRDTHTCEHGMERRSGTTLQQQDKHMLQSLTVEPISLASTAAALSAGPPISASALHATPNLVNELCHGAMCVTPHAITLFPVVKPTLM